MRKKIGAFFFFVLCFACASHGQQDSVVQDSFLSEKKSFHTDKLTLKKAGYIETLYDKGKYTEAIRFGNQLLSKKDSLTKEEVYIVYNSLLNSYLKAGYHQKYLELIPEKYEASKEYYQEDEAIKKEYRNLASLYNKTKQYDKSRFYTQKVIKILQQTNGELSLQSSLTNNIALTFKRENNSDSALIYFKQALQLAKKASFKMKPPIYKQHFINIIESDIAYLNIPSGNYNHIIYCLNKEIASAKQVNEPHIYLSAWNKMGHIYYQKKEYDSAMFYLEMGDKEFEVKYMDDLHVDNLTLKAKVAIANKQQKLSEKLFLEVKLIQDSIDVKKSKALAEVATVLYETLRKEEEIQQQQLILSDRSETIKQQNKTQIILTIITSLLFAALFLLFLFNRKLHRKNRKIEEQKILVNDSLKQKDLLLKEVHHRVKNNLQVISGILNKQAKISSNPSVKSMMKEGQNRIKSMALVHQRLYQTEDFRNIDIKSYIKDLTKSILMSHQQADTNIELELDLSETNFHIDVAIPLGSILNELLTNAYKYAFVGRTTGKVSVSIIEKEKHQFEMRVIDNGIGLPENLTEKVKDSIGLSLVKGLAWQLRGKLEYYTDNGSVFVILFTDQLKKT